MASDASSAERYRESANIILILTDDQGWTSLSRGMDSAHPAVRSDYHRTPHMDKLLARGMRFPNGYAASPICSPSRYSIQFGKTPARLGKTLVRGPNTVDHSQLSLPQALKKHDPRYRCAHFGKWHIKVKPEQLGYDVSDGATTNEDGGFTNGKPAEWNGYSAEDPKKVQYVTDRGIAFMREQVANKQPFFLQLSHYAVHSDVVYREETLNAVKTWKPGRIHKHVGYAAMMKDLDDAIGRFMMAYDELQLSGTTYLFFVSDNGGMPVIPPQLRHGAAYGTGEGLNSPLRRGKWDLTEGGIRVPFVVLGPGIKSGSQCNAAVVHYDLMPTFLELAGSSAPAPSDLDGGSFAAMLRDATKKKMARPLGDTLIFHLPHYNMVGLAEPHSAIRQGAYKLLRFHSSKRSLLFDLDRDIGEQVDLSKQMPQRVQALEEALNNYLASVRAEQPEQSITWNRGKEGKTKTAFLSDFE